MSKTLHKGEGCNFVLNDDNIVKEALKIERNKRIGQTLFFNKPISVIGYASSGGVKESKGPIGGYIDNKIHDDEINSKTFEKAEYEMLYSTAKKAVINAGISLSSIDAFLAGDLLNQITTSSFVARELNVPYLGLYSACSTMTEALVIGSILIDGGFSNNCLCATASHFATAERQYRYPLEYGCQRPPYAQWTVTGAGATVLSNSTSKIKITSATIGKVVDFGTNDLNNMGASMAPAAMQSMISLFNDTKTLPNDYDLIITGDLGKLGSDILRDLMKEQGYNLGQNYIDCGSLIYDGTQNCYQGGSGCGCSACVVNSFIFDKMNAGEIKSVAYFATGALMSSQSCYQGETIPCISHGVVIRSNL